MDYENKGYYQLNNQVLKFDIDKNLNEIRFNHYIMQKENLQRVKGDLPRGQFYMSTRTLSGDLNITFAKAQRLIKKFTEIGIISSVYMSPNGHKKLSIWQYNSAQKIDTVNDTVDDTVNDTVKPNNINGLDDISDTVDDTKDDMVSDTYKKEYIKRINKNNIIVMTSSEQEFIDTLKQIENYPVDLKKDIELYKTLEERYPKLNLVQAIKDWAVYKQDVPLKAKSNARSQINTSFKKYVEWGKCLKNNQINKFDNNNCNENSSLYYKNNDPPPEIKDW